MTRRGFGKKTPVAAAFLVLALLCPAAWGLAEPTPNLDQVRRGRIRNYPRLSAENLILIKHAYVNFHRGIKLKYPWPAMEQLSPTPTLVVGPENQHLMGHPSPPDSYFLTKKPFVFFMHVYGKEAEFDCGISTTRPLYGSPTIIKTAIECSGETANEFLFEYTRGCFRLYLYRQNELLKISRLNLPFPDPKEEWKSRFPFPYDDPEVITIFRDLAKTANDMFWVQDMGRRKELLEAYLPKRRRLGEALEARSGQYSNVDFLKYVMWAEGVPLYAAYEMYEFAGRTALVPKELGDFDSFTSYASWSRTGLKKRFQHFRSQEQKPLVFDDLVMLGALVSGTAAAIVPDWRPYSVERDVWVDDLVARARIEAP